MRLAIELRQDPGTAVDVWTRPASGFGLSPQLRNDGVAAASSDVTPLAGGPRQRQKRQEGAPTWESDGGPGWLRYATAPPPTFYVWQPLA